MPLEAKPQLPTFSSMLAASREPEPSTTDLMAGRAQQSGPGGQGLAVEAWRSGPGGQGLPVRAWQLGRRAASAHARDVLRRHGRGRAELRCAELAQPAYPGCRAGVITCIAQSSTLSLVKMWTPKTRT